MSKQDNMFYYCTQMAIGSMVFHLSGAIAFFSDQTTVIHDEIPRAAKDDVAGGEFSRLFCLCCDYS